ncbi:MAG: hypothetical protein HYZ14_06895 [Bacteroidetes bacterium]|nr:hypothetical protein [Bacteroidota bacterium]
MKHFLLFPIAFIFLSACREDAAEPTTSIEGTMYRDQEVVAQIAIQVDAESNPVSIEGSGVSFAGELSQNDEIWFSFEAQQGELYKIWWQDSWWEEYTAGSIYVTAYKQDLYSTYFPEERLLQMGGSPKFIVADETGPVYLKVRGYDGEIEGTFSVNVSAIPVSLAEMMTPDSTYNYTIPLGDMILLAATVEKDSSYSLLVDGSPYCFPYGSQTEANVSIIPENNHQPYFYAENIFSSGLGGTDTVRQFTALASGTVYISLMGAYWWEPRDVTAKFWKN